ncbi:B3 domain-containing protein [Cephalotus follicularis]|uniref:B3 domain-containing protein n=1 Tax=Cephalotus follicularis TaxID=3775 RepID=A0A1Q3BEU2_CEPFO|nr:B3 domain-containing protein [Cephalotus follicularis]
MVAPKRTSYEEIRQRRVEENKKRLEEFNLKKLSQDLRNATQKPTPVKPRVLRKPVDLTPSRRSSRIAVKPPPNYKDVPLEPLGRTRRSPYQRRDLLNRVYASDEERVHAIERADEIQSDLDPAFPSFIKPMLQSHVTGGFWLGLPSHFCKTHLPPEDEMITLVDENGEESSTKYLAEKTGLSGGWRGFAIDHQLVDGDALVFQLIRPTEFKVYIVRAYESVIKTENPEGNDKESDVTHLNSSAKRIRASSLLSSLFLIKC